MIDFFGEVVRLLEQGDRVAIATLVARLGSAPGALGSKMLVRADGTTLGTIGGGCVEADVWQAAMSARKSGRPTLLSFRLSASDAAEGGLICGGTIEILVEPVQDRHVSLYRRLSHELRSRGRLVLGTILPESTEEDGVAPQPGDCLAFAPGDKALWTMGEESTGDLLEATLTTEARALLETSPHSEALVLRTELNGCSARVLLEFFAPQSTVYVFGAGHLSREIVPLAKHVGFRVVVIDDRELFLSRGAFPDADELVTAEFGNVLEELDIGDESYLVIVTRGHQYDGVVLEQALRFKPRYVGMIGSRVKIASIKAGLRAAGVAEETLTEVHAPIGVPIAARSPEEIAVSIVAELIGVRGRQASG